MASVLVVTAPIYLLIAAGYAFVRLGWMAAPDMFVLGRFVTRLCMPALLFRAIARQPIGAVLHADYLAIYAAGSLTVLLAVTLFARYIRGRPMSLAAIQGLGSAGSNSVFIGYPIVVQAIGPTAGVALAMGTLTENLLVLPLALALAGMGADGGRSPHAILTGMARDLTRNPMILAIAAGLVVSAVGGGLPDVLDRTLALPAAAAAPTALFVIGGSLVGLHLTGIRGDLALVTGAKLVLHPLCMLAFVLLFPPADPALRAAAVLFAGMPMLSIYAVVAQRYGHERFCAAALLAATVASFVSISVLITLLPADWLASGERPGP